MKKKGFEMSIGLIVTAAIALVVLVVILVIFGMKSGQFSAGTSNCESLGGECNSYTSATCKSAGGAAVFIGKCPDKGTCCKKVET